MSTRRCSGSTSRAARPVTFEVITRRIEDRGGGLARVNGQAAPGRRTGAAARGGRVRPLLLQLQHQLDRRSIHCWPSSGLPAPISRRRGQSGDGRARRWPRACRPTSRSRMSRSAGATARKTSFPVGQFEKLWGDMTALPELDVASSSCRGCAGSSSRSRHSSTAGCAMAPRRTWSRLCEW